MTARKPKELHKKRGQPTRYKPEYAETAHKLCQKGLTDYEISQFFEVSIATITNWKNAHPEFLAALKSGKEASDNRVERSLFHRAIGYSFEAEEVFQYQGEIIRAKVIKHVPPDTTSMIFWLKNRRKAEWRDVHNHDVRVTAEYDRMSDEELAARLREGAKLLLEAPKVIEHDDGTENS
jgi:hypothetical protein